MSEKYLTVGKLIEILNRYDKSLLVECGHCCPEFLTEDAIKLFEHPGVESGKHNEFQRYLIICDY